jgi:Flp pilus assembly protein TadB
MIDIAKRRLHQLWFISIESSACIIVMLLTPSFGLRITMGCVLLVNLVFFPIYVKHYLEAQRLQAASDALDREHRQLMAEVTGEAP